MKKVDIAIHQADANAGFEGMNLTDEEKHKIKKDLQEKKSLLISFLNLYHERQRKTKDVPKHGKNK